MIKARLSIFYAGQLIELPSTIAFDTLDEPIIDFVLSAIHIGLIKGPPHDKDTNLDGFVVDRYEPSQRRTLHEIVVRPKTRFDAAFPPKPRPLYSGTQAYPDNVTATTTTCPHCGGRFNA